MIKRLICSILVLATFMSMLAVNVSAAEYYYEDFSNVTTSTSAGAKVYCRIPNLTNTTTPCADYRVDNGALLFKKASYSDDVYPEVGLYYDPKPEKSTELFFEMDFMLNTNHPMGSNGDLIMYIYAQKKRFSVQISPWGLIGSYSDTTGRALLTKNVWYSALMHMKLSEGTVDVYQKLKTDDAYTYLLTRSLDNRTSANYYMMLYGTKAKKTDMLVDNVKVYDGVNVKNPYFTMDGTKITSIDDVGNGTLSVNAEVLYGEMATATVGSVKKTTNKAVTPVMTVFDKDGKMVECVIPTSFGLKPGTNNLTIDYNTSGYYDKITDGSIGFYFWKDITTVRPLTDAIELKK